MVNNQEVRVKPDFIIIGAMKCATSTLHDQLALQADFFMSTPKEPNFFSDDDVYSNGFDWYEGLFAGAKEGQIKGESSTHYTKLPTYPETVERIISYAPQVKCVYVMRHPVDRLISHYIHEWTQGVISCDINTAISRFPQLVEYSCYNMQLKSYFSYFGASQILPLFAERLRVNPLGELQAIFDFLDVTTMPVWHANTVSNVSAQRMKRCLWRDRIVDNSFARVLRRTFVPKSLRTKIRNLWTMRERPVLSPENLEFVEDKCNNDLKALGDSLGLILSCENFKKVITSNNHIGWVGSSEG